MPQALIRAIAFAALIVCAPTGARGQDASVALRLTGEPTPAVDTVIARNMRPRVLNMRPDAPTESYGDLVTRHCGSFREAYFSALRDANGSRGIERDAIVGEGKLTLPACLFHAPLEREGELAWLGLGRLTVFQGFTGRWPNPYEEASYFEFAPTPSTPPFADPFITSEVVVTPTRMSVGELDALLRATDGGELVLRDEPSDGDGNVVLALGADDERCRAAPRRPFDPDLVSAAHAFAFRRAMTEARAVHALIVDNGFFGADHRAQPGHEFDGGPFVARMFERGRQGEGFLAHRLRPSSFFAVNYANAVTPNAISSHGTHVTGLALGGPLMHKAALWRADDPWLRISILNVAGGAERLAPHSASAIRDAVRTDRRSIVNMSLAYGPSALGDLEGLFRTYPNALFVAAAGNIPRGAGALSPSMLPANMGGLSSFNNLMTVAALDGDRLAEFSHRGAFVDIAAPGCRLMSWTENTLNETSESGTSMAAPLVTFAAALLASTSDDFTPQHLRTRLIVSGDFMIRSNEGGQPEETTAFNTALNIEHALYWTDDILTVSGESAGTYLGDVTALTGLRCRGAPLVAADLWALKRDGADDLWAFRGRLAGRLGEPCKVTVTTGAEVRIAAAWTLPGPASAPSEEHFPIALVRDLVFASPIRPLKRGE